MLIALRVFLPFALTYLLSYLLRVVNAVAGEPISADFGLTPADLGLLTSVYLAGFALCQLPLGILMDRYGPRRVEALTLLLAVGGCALFALATSLTELVVGRILMGVGTSICLMAPFTAYRSWFTPERLPLVIGLHLAFGAAGSALGGLPAEMLMAAVGWPGLFAILGMLVLVAAGAIYGIVPARNEPREPQPLSDLGRELGAVVKSRALWRLAPLSATSQAGFLAVLGLWTGPWLREVAGLSPAAAAGWLSISAVGLMLGFLGYGIAASWAAKRGRTLDVFVGGTVLSAIVTLLIIVLPPAMATPLWIAYAALGSGGVLSYALVSASFAPAFAGRVNTTLNFIVFFFSFLVQWTFGIVLDLVPGEPAAGYNVALVALLVLQGLSYLPLLLRPGAQHAASTAR